MLCSLHCFHGTAVHVAGVANPIADALFRLRLQELTAGTTCTNFTGQGTALPLGRRLLEDMYRYASLAISGSTRWTYSASEQSHLGFCAVCRWDPLPASDFMLSAFAAHIAGHVKPGTVRVYLAAVRNLHLNLGLPDLTADAALLPRVTKGISRKGLPGVNRPRLPITTVVLRQLVHVLLGSYLPIADRVMLHAAMLLTFHGCMRCGEFTTPVNYDHRRHASRGDITVDSERMQ